MLFPPQGDTVLTGSKDNTCRLWRVIRENDDVDDVDDTYGYRRV